MKKNHIWFVAVCIFVIFISACEANTSNSSSSEDDVLSSATAPADASNVIGSPTDTSARISWTAPMLTSSHKKADGTKLTTADVSYKVYRVVKGAKSRTIAEIKTADTTPLAVAKGTTSTNITNLTRSTTYEIVIVAVNAAAPTKASTGIRIEVTTLATNQATAPADASNVTGSPTDTSARISWTAPALTTSHKKANGQALTTADVSYKVYHVAKGSDERTIEQIKTADTTPLAVAKGTTSTNITNLTRSTTYEIVIVAVNATDTTKVSTGVRIEITTLANSHATAPPDTPVYVAGGSITDTSIRIIWQAPTLDNSHRKANGKALTTAEVSYKVYHVAKGSNERTIEQIKTADTTPLEVASIAVAKRTIRASINNLTRSTTYEIVVQAVNATDTTKVSTGIRVEASTLANNNATAPPDARSVTAGSTTASNTIISWQAPTLDTSYKKANGQVLTKEYIYYKVYRAVKGSDDRTIAQIKEADTTPLEVAPLEVANGTISKSINNLTGNTTYEIVVQAVNVTDPTKASTGIRIEVATTNPATAPPEVSSITGSPTDISARVSWTAPMLTNDHKKANGGRLTTAEVSYKVYHVAKGSDERTIAQIKEADTTPIEVAKGTTSTNITNLTPNTTYEIVVQAVNATDPTKASTGIRIEGPTLANNQATAPTEPRVVTGRSTDDSALIRWLPSRLTNNHKKANGQALTKADVSYKVYRVVKGSDERTTAQIKEADTTPLEVAKGTTRITIHNLTGSTTYEIVVQAVNATDTTKVSTGIRIEVTTLATISMKAKQQGSSTTFTTLFTTAQGKNGTTTITPIVMEVTPSDVVSEGTFSISPNLTENTGISFNTSNGTISGIAKYIQSETTYTITFTATDSRTVQTTIDIIVVGKYIPKNRTELIRTIKTIIDTNKDGTIDNKDDLDADLNNIDTSSITSMRYLFAKSITKLHQFSGDISKWDVSNVTDMYGMFQDATAFNSDISKWDVSKVTSMSWMFRGATAFNSDISDWHVSKVTDMLAMFGKATAFNSDISDWKVGKVTDMSGMFEGATAFNSDISDWKVGKVTNMSFMFEGAIAFNSDISTWDVSKVTNMSDMFKEASSFNRDLEAWGEHIGESVTMDGMFENSKVTTPPTWYKSTE